MTRTVEPGYPMLKKTSILARLCALSLVCALSACSGAEPAVEDLRPVMVAQAQSSHGQAELFSGTVRARHEIDMSFRLNGKIAQRLVDVGDRVKANQLLARLDPEDAALAVQAAQAAVLSAESEQRLAQAEFQRHLALSEKQQVSLSLLDTKRTALEAKQAALAQSRVALDSALNQKNYTELRAPGAGVIAARMAEAGQVVAAGQPIFKLAEGGEREIAINLPEQSVAQFLIGQTARVRLWAQPETIYEAQLREISPAADAVTRTYAARVALKDAKLQSALGQSAQVVFSQNNGNGLALPLATLIRAENRVADIWVWSPETSRIQKRSIEFENFDENAIRVTSGLEPTEWVVQAGVHLLLEGQKLRAVDRQNRPVEPTGQAE